MSSAECQAMIDKYQGYKEQINNLIGSIYTCIDEITKGSQIIELIIINGKPIDNGLLEGLSGSLSGFIGILNTLVSECDDMIAKYTALKAQALAREAEMYRRSLEEDELDV